ncbi:MAG: hypothetical protein AAF203_08585 [Pseudomonadota bacterium]
MKYFFLFIGLVVGVLLSSLLNPRGFDPNPIKNELVKAASDRERLDKLGSQVQEFYDVDFEEYKNLKSMKSKYLKANELLGKMMTLFLAELSLRISENDLKNALNTAEAIASEDDDSPSSSKECSQTQKKCPTLKELADKFGKQIVEIQEKKRVWADREKKLPNPGSVDEIDNFLKEVTMDDFFSEIAKSSFMNESKVKKMQGVFEGVLTYFDPETPDTDVLIEFDGVVEKGEVVGNRKVQLSRNGKAFSTSTGDGTQKGMRQITDSEAFFVETGKSYFQLYEISSSDLIGNFYREKSVGTFEKIGTVRLTRR